MKTGKILVVDDELDIRRLLQEILSEEGYEVQVAADAEQARAARGRQLPDLILLDIWMPGTDGITLLREWSGEPDFGPVVMMSGHGTVETAVEATRLGACDFIEKPLSLAKLLRTVERALDVKSRRGVGKLTGAREQAITIPGRSRAVTQLRSELGRLAASTAPLLLLGESGTDRELLARYVHQAGPSAAGPFVVVDSRALGDESAAAVLLGTAASQPGLLAGARGGTVYLGDIDDLGTVAQRLLSGVFESGHFTRSPGGEPIAIEARIISSARPGIVQQVAADVFRRDLYAQLSVLVLRVPALRDYAEDIPELLRHYVDLLTEAEGLRFRRFSVAAQNRLRNYPWPDNLRELRSLTRRFLTNEGAEEISLEEVERELSTQTALDEPLVKHDLLALPLREAREQFERAYLQQQLLLCNGKVGLLAKRVDMERTHLYRKLRSLGIEIGQGAEE